MWSFYLDLSSGERDKITKADAKVGAAVVLLLLLCVHGLMWCYIRI